MIMISLETAVLLWFIGTVTGIKALLYIGTVFLTIYGIFSLMYLIGMFGSMFN